MKYSFEGDSHEDGLSIDQSYIFSKFVDGWTPNARSNFKQVITKCIFLTYGTTEAKLWPSYNCIIDIYYFTIVSHYIKYCKIIQVIT